MNSNIIPYVPIADRVQASNPESELRCQQLFNIIDHAVAAQLSFNHDTSTGVLSLCPEQINDLINELAQHEKTSGMPIEKKLDIKFLRLALDDLIYPIFTGEFEITSPIWNSSNVTVWQFKLNQTIRENPMKKSLEIDLLLDQAIAALRVWRTSLETSTDNPQVTYDTDDIVYNLLDIEQKLEQVQLHLE